MRHSQVNVGPVELHVVELGSGKPVLFCHGFPDLWIGWRRQMEAIAARGYRAIAVDMRGYGRSSAVDDPYGYTAFHTVGDLVKLLDVLAIPTVTVVGHDFGATIAWFATMMRPDIFKAVYGVSVPYLQPTDTNMVEQMRNAGQHFYMFDMMKPEAAQQWSDASITIPGFMYWSSGTPAAPDRWNPFDAERAMYRKAPVDVPPWADPMDVDYVVREFNRTGFVPALNYYRSIEPFFDLARPFRAALIHQPAFFAYGEVDGVAKMRKPDENELRSIVPGLRGFLALPNVGHWPQQEASEQISESLLQFLASVEE